MEPRSPDLETVVDLWLSPPRLPAPDLLAGGRLPVPERHALRLPDIPLPSLPPIPPHDAWGAGGEAVGYVFGDTGPTVLLVHGWGGSAGQFALWIGALLRAGYRVAALDAPAHGASGGNMASAPAFAGAIREFSRSVGGFDFGVSHSLGAIATTLAMADGEALRRLVFLAPCCDVVETLYAEGRRQGVPEERFGELAATFTRRFGTDVALETARARVRDLPPLLILHDPEDEATPFAEAQEAANAWPGARLEALSGTGHQRILISRAAVLQGLAFLDAAGASPSHG